jgi:hypothetical protein
MSSINRTNWRQRESEKIARAAEAEHLKRTAKTEENFPTTLIATARRIDQDGPDLAQRALQAHIQDEVRKQLEAYRTAKTERERRNIINGVYIFRRNRDLADVEDEYEDEYEEYHQPINEKYPPHGKRGTYTPVYSDPEFGALAAAEAPTNPDGTRPTADEFSEGWRNVTKRIRRKRVMTNAELERAAALSQDENSEEGDHNGDLTERNQRRDFY